MRDSGIYIRIQLAILVLPATSNVDFTPRLLQISFGIDFNIFFDISIDFIIGVDIGVVDNVLLWIIGTELNTKFSYC